MAGFQRRGNFRGNNGPQQAPQQQPQQNGGNGTGNQPMRRFYHQVRGGTLCVSVWPKDVQGDQGTNTLYSFTVQRSYQKTEKDRDWTNYLHEEDVPVAALALQQAYLWLAEQKNKE